MDALYHETLTHLALAYCNSRKLLPDYSIDGWVTCSYEHLDATVYICFRRSAGGDLLFHKIAENGDSFEWDYYGPEAFEWLRDRS